jgi:hypothetical protein
MDQRVVVGNLDKSLCDIISKSYSGYFFWPKKDDNITLGYLDLVKDSVYLSLFSKLNNSDKDYNFIFAVIGENKEVIDSKVKEVVDNFNVEMKNAPKPLENYSNEFVAYLNSISSQKKSFLKNFFN